MSERMRILTEVPYYDNMYRYLRSSQHNEIITWLQENIANKNQFKWHTVRCANGNQVEVLLDGEAKDVAALFLLAWGGKIV